MNYSVNDYNLKGNHELTYNHSSYTTQNTIVHNNTHKLHSLLIKSPEQTEDNFNWSTFWSDANNNHIALTNDDPLTNAPTNHVESGSLRHNNTPYQRSPAAALIRKKTFFIECCGTQITNFDAMKKHIKDFHTIDELFYAGTHYEKDLSYSTAALAASKVISTAIPGFFNCPDKDCRLNLACLTSLRNHYKRKHNNKPIEETI
ncbi:hypothetical protein Noda2021_01350 [Candidatus Dependentiae bacterium Noda2021]|nr:hypothetical protein Noda2021_01350 [Candidatus Dependentiae bacterium Noda2021]